MYQFSTSKAIETVMLPVMVPVNSIILVATDAPVDPSDTLRGVSPVPLHACAL